MVRPEIGKFSTARWVCAAYLAPRGTTDLAHRVVLGPERRLGSLAASSGESVMPSKLAGAPSRRRAECAGATAAFSRRLRPGRASGWDGNGTPSVLQALLQPQQGTSVHEPPPRPPGPDGHRHRQRRRLRRHRRRPGRQPRRGGPQGVGPASPTTTVTSPDPAVIGAGRLRGRPRDGSTPRGRRHPARLSSRASARVPATMGPSGGS